MTIQTALLQGHKLLEEAGIDVPRLTAEVLLAHATGQDRAWLYAHSSDELIEVWWIHYGRYLHQRVKETPTQYITGRQEFYGREFRVTPDVLIPRPETEHVIEAALEKWPETGIVLDIGTGSGAIAITLALEQGGAEAHVREGPPGPGSGAQRRADEGVGCGPGGPPHETTHLIATDLSLAALGVAAGNARRLEAPVEFVACDLASPLADGCCGLVVSNPPYISLAEKATLAREVRDCEPEIALYGGQDGLDIYRRLIPEASRILQLGGWLVLEIGATQAEAVRGLLGSWSEVEVRADLAGLPRVVLARHTR